MLCFVGLANRCVHTMSNLSGIFFVTSHVRNAFHIQNQSKRFDIEIGFSWPDRLHRQCYQTTMQPRRTHKIKYVRWPLSPFPLQHTSTTAPPYRTSVQFANLSIISSTMMFGNPVA